MELIVDNKKARFEYFLYDTFEAGIVLEGSEVKSLRNKEASLLDSFIFLRNNEVYIKNMYIKPYKQSTITPPDERRDRKLLLSKREILKLLRATKEKALTIVPTKVYFKGNLVKIEIATAKGKKLFDKRETIKRKEQDREMQRKLKM
ncbi:MAG: SsrA-binding protein SmpB [Clostridiales bacterium]|nr:SsrA-binding protein SmpB [Candidatus Apopatousia equi]